MKIIKLQAENIKKLTVVEIVPSQPFRTSVLQAREHVSKIDKPGRYALTEAEYHGDVAVGPSLSSSGAATLIDSCPAMYFYSSYLNEKRPEEETTKDMDIGSAVHIMILEPHRWEERVAVFDEDGWRSKEAKTFKAQARLDGKIPLLTKHAEEARIIAKAALDQPIAGKAFAGGESEQSYVYRDEDSGIWCKARVDKRRVQDGRVQIIQLKTVPDAQPRAFERHAYDMGYFQRAAWEIETVKIVEGLDYEPEYWFIASERKPPYLLSMCKPDDRSIQYGFMMNAKARAIFAECCASKRWPGYSDRAVQIGLPGYAHFQIEDRRVAGEFDVKPTKKKIERATEAFRP